jgi:uncharacterized protein YunC (DUF1805 family)
MHHGVARTITSRPVDRAISETIDKTMAGLLIVKVLKEDAQTNFPVVGVNSLDDIAELCQFGVALVAALLGIYLERRNWVADVLFI